MTILTKTGPGRLSRRRFIAISAAAASFVPLRSIARSASVRPITWRGIALGANVSITLHHEDEVAAHRAIADCLAEVSRLEAIFSLHRPDSAIVRLNTAGELTEAPADLRTLLSLALSIADRSGGAFDPTVQPLWRLYARHFESPWAEPEGPGAALVEETLSRVGWRHVDLNGAGVRFDRPNMAITLNGIAQGYITDKVGEVLRRNGFEHVLVDMGEQLALGPKMDGSAWQVGIAAPRVDNALQARQDVATQFPLSRGAIATSGTLGTTFDPARRVSHILDARTGRPAITVTSVSVLAPSAALADGLSTALAILPASQAPLLVGNDARAVIVTRDGKVASLT